MKKWLYFLSKMIQKERPQHMGRWKIETCNAKLNNKIDMSNEDHCGPCGQYAKTKSSVDVEKSIIVYDKNVKKE